MIFKRKNHCCVEVTAEPEGLSYKEIHELFDDAMKNIKVDGLHKKSNRIKYQVLEALIKDSDEVMNWLKEDILDLPEYDAIMESYESKIDTLNTEIIILKGSITNTPQYTFDPIKVRNELDMCQEILGNRTRELDDLYKTNNRLHRDIGDKDYKISELKDELQIAKQDYQNLKYAPPIQDYTGMSTHEPVPPRRTPPPMPGFNDPMNRINLSSFTDCVMVTYDAYGNRAETWYGIDRNHILNTGDCSVQITDKYGCTYTSYCYKYKLTCNITGETWEEYV